ncbi:MAG TPA: hypothetical protein HA254_02740 [Candidatus Diapherotrites archaeon]|uniref:Uncharacterized protein n=1 Tax=Candidatus Iainarchaeum sp. TaxID=3101447 RepID=A0A7J4J2U8_9ARCH|nr:hypothetical protein [Candidatus Diapherotrites archaeon]
MVFVNLDKKQPKQVQQGKVSVKQYKCVNCGEIIDNPFGSIEARRFCSRRCHDEYFSPLG